MIKGELSERSIMEISNIQIITIELLYTIAVILPAMFVFFKTKKLYNFSSYKGLKYFGLAFLFISTGFILRFFVMLNKVSHGNFVNTIDQFDFLLLGMIFFLCAGGFLLVYSLVWKKFEKIFYDTTPINKALFLIYSLALIISIVDYLNQSFLFYYSSQILVFGIAGVVSYRSYLTNKQKYKQFYFISMVLFLVVMIINLIAQYTIDSYPYIRFYTYILTAIIMFIFYYVTKQLLGAKNKDGR